MSDDFEVIPTNGNIDGKGYSDFIKDYWHFLLGSNPDNPVYQDTTIFTRGCQNYRDVNSSENVRRKNFCGILEETPSIIHTVGSQNNPFRIRSNLPVFVTVLDTIALEPEIDENGREVTQDEVLRRENDAVRPQDVQLTIRKKGGGSQSVSNLFNDHRTSANFSLVIPRTSVLAERLEREIKVDTTYPNAKAEGYYALIKFNIPEVYNIKSDGYGVRGYISKADYHIEIPKEPK